MHLIRALDAKTVETTTTQAFSTLLEIAPTSSAQEASPAAISEAMVVLDKLKGTQYVILHDYCENIDSTCYN